MTKKDTLWFPHDYNARSDKNAAPLLSDYGAEGYGVFTILTEILHEEPDSRIEYSEKNLRRLASPCRVEYNRFKSIVDDCIHIYELWRLEDGHISSGRVLRNKAERERMRETKRQNGRKGGEASAQKLKAAAGQQLPPAGQNTANTTTEQDSTEQDKHTSTPTAGMLPLAVLAKNCVGDEVFIGVCERVGLPGDKLGGWLHAFNRRLEYMGERSRTEQEYRAHFGNWIKTRPYKTQNPQDYNPVDEGSAHKQAQPATGKIKTAQQLLEERKKA